MKILLYVLGGAAIIGGAVFGVSKLTGTTNTNTVAQSVQNVTNSNSLNTPTTASGSSQTTYNVPKNCNTESITQISEKQVTYPNKGGAELVNDYVLSGLPTNVQGGTKVVKGEDNVNSFQFFLENGKTVKLIENGKEIKKVSLETGSEPKFLTIAQIPIDSGDYCGAMSLNMGTIGQYLDMPKYAEYMWPDMNADGKWFLQKSNPIGKALGVDGSFNRWIIDSSSDGTGYITIETRMLGLKMLGESTTDVSISYEVIDLSTGLIQRSVSLSYPAGATSVDQIDTSKSIESWIESHKEATSFVYKEYSYSGGGNSNPPILPPTNCKTGGSVTDPSCKHPPTNLAVKFIIKDEDSDVTGTVKLTWQNNGAYSGIEIERAKEKNFTDWTKVKSISGSEVKYSDDLATIQLPENKEGYRVRAIYSDGTYSEYTNIAELNNCIPIYGQGSQKIVFMRMDDNENMNTKSFASLMINDAVNKGFASIDPFKAYVDRFSFSIDLKQLKHADLAVDATTGRYDESSASTVINSSSCGVGAREYITAANPNGSTEGYMLGYSSTGNRVSFLTKNSYGYLFYATVIHEMGHVFGGLADEYFIGDVGSPGTENCSGEYLLKYGQYTNSKDNLVYGALDIKGCKYKTFTDGTSNYRPSKFSIMNDDAYPEHQKFNVISCGYVISGILGEKIDKDMAETHWPACMKMDIIKDGIPQATLNAYK